MQPYHPNMYPDQPMYAPNQPYPHHGYMQNPPPPPGVPYYNNAPPHPPPPPNASNYQCDTQPNTRSEPVVKEVIHKETVVKNNDSNNRDCLTCCLGCMTLAFCLELFSR